MWSKRKKARTEARVPARFDTGIGDECEAYLAGQLAVYLQDQARPVPPVGWLNQVAHASPAELALLSLGQSDGIESPVWRRAVGYLARSLLERGRETGRPLEDLQRGFRVPLELELFGDPEAERLDSADLILVTLTRLYGLPELSA